MYRIPPDRYRDNLERFVELLDLRDQLDTPVRQLSLGQRMRGDITAALLHDPEILYLDEPTIGLDVVSKGRLREFLRALNAERGTTLVLTTHDLQDIEALCDRVIVIDHGTSVFDGPLAALQEQGGSTRTLVVDLVDEVPPIEVPGAVVRRVEGPRQWLSFPVHESAAPVVAAVAAAYDVADLSIQEPDIEEVIRDLYSRGAPGVPRREARAVEHQHGPVVVAARHLAQHRPGDAGEALGQHRAAGHVAAARPARRRGRDRASRSRRRCRTSAPPPSPSRPSLARSSGSGTTPSAVPRALSTPHSPRPGCQCSTGGCPALVIV